MSVWVEKPADTGSAVWGCSTCDRGAWCSDHTTARLEARTHARGHGESTVNVIRAHRGPTADQTRDNRIRTLRSAGHSIRQIAETVGISNAGVTKSLARTRANA
ncbi:helix-turn-helix resolvase-like protein [Microbacterium sp. AG790]|uniref:helix-turn-helix domain-containing protein n=1 Tax=Microbacterium sp. AG790 TaxID=2183995 RepID=UPI000F228C9C|nr:helix-turn-helix domain-containing protein [Microbacterium sp. AG790]RKS84827.1 helix-turn-helix resolvase-like protein [Microbacterium sp. AG790]